MLLYCWTILSTSFLILCVIWIFWTSWHNALLNNDWPNYTLMRRLMLVITSSWVLVKNKCEKFDKIASKHTQRCPLPVKVDRLVNMVQVCTGIKHKLTWCLISYRLQMYAFWNKMTYIIRIIFHSADCINFKHNPENFNVLPSIHQHVCLDINISVTHDVPPKVTMRMGWNLLSSAKK